MELLSRLKTNTWWDIGISDFKHKRFPLKRYSNSGGGGEEEKDQNVEISNGSTNCGHQQDDQLMTLN